METTTAFSSIEVYSVVGGTRNDQVMSLDIETNSNNTVPTNTNTNTEKKTTGNNQGAKFDYQLFIKKVCMDVFLLLQGESKTPVSKYLKLAAKDWRHSVPYWAHNILGWIISLIANTNVFVGVFSYLVSTMQDEK